MKNHTSAISVARNFRLTLTSKPTCAFIQERSLFHAYTPVATRDSIRNQTCMLTCRRTISMTQGTNTCPWCTLRCKDSSGHSTSRILGFTLRQVQISVTSQTKTRWKGKRLRWAVKRLTRKSQRSWERTMETFLRSIKKRTTPQVPRVLANYWSSIQISQSQIVGFDTSP